MGAMIMTMILTKIVAKLIAQCAMQAALVSCAASPVTLLVISIADFSKHATPDVLRVMRDEVHSLTSHV